MGTISPIQLQILLGVGLKKTQTYNDDDKSDELFGEKVLRFRKGGDGGVLTLTGEHISELTVHSWCFSAFSCGVFFVYGRKILVRQVCIPLSKSLVCGGPSSSSSLPGVPETHPHPCSCIQGCCGTGLGCVTPTLSLWRGCICWAEGAAHLQVVSACETCSSSPAAFPLQ